MRKTLLAGLALMSLAACKGGAKVAQVKPPVVTQHAATPKGRKPTTVARTPTTAARKPTTVARKPTRKAPAPEDTATPRNPLLNH